MLKIKQKQALKAALLQSTRLRVDQQMTSPNYAQTTALRRLEANLSFLRSEEPKARVRKGRKTHTASDEEELRMSESLERERKPFLQAVATKLEKAKDKLTFNCSPFMERPIAHLLPAKLQVLASIPKLSDIFFLCSIEPVHRNVPEIMGVELEGLSDLSVSCLRFPPTATHQRREETLSAFVEITQTGKKLLGGPAKSLFPTRSLSFLPVWGLALADDELLLINELPENLTPLAQFLGQLEVGVGEQHLAVVRYLVRGCLKAIQQAGAQGLTAILLPTSLFLNERYEPRIRNALYALLLLQQFPHLLTEEDLAYYPPEQRPEPAGAALWSLGVLAHQLCYGSLPFPKYQPLSWSSREEFLVVNQLQTPARTAPYEKCREFIHHCLARTGNLSLQELTRDPFLGCPR